MICCQGPISVLPVGRETALPSDASSPLLWLRLLSTPLPGPAVLAGPSQDVPALLTGSVARQSVGTPSPPGEDRLPEAQPSCGSWLCGPVVSWHLGERKVVADVSSAGGYREPRDCSGCPRPIPSASQKHSYVSNLRELKQLRFDWKEFRIGLCLHSTHEQGPFCVTLQHCFGVITLGFSGSLSKETLQKCFPGLRYGVP